MTNFNSFSPIRHLTYPGNVLLVDGLTGTGKTMIARRLAAASGRC